MEISITSAKARLTELVRRAEEGEDIVLTRHGHPIATISATKPRQSKSQRAKDLERFLGCAVGMVPEGTTSAGAQASLYDDDGLPK